MRTYHLFVNLERADIQFTNYAPILHGRLDHSPAYSYNNQEISSVPFSAGNGDAQFPWT